MAGTSPHGGGHEKRDISIRGALLLAVGIVAVVPLAMLAMNLLFRFLAAREARLQPPPISQVPGEARPLPPEPRLQMSPALDYRKIRAGEDEALASYGWIDRSRGKVRIPVARAIELLVEQPLPSRPQKAPEASR